MSRAIPFRDRAEAGRALAGELDRYAGRSDVVVLALPRGGVPVAAQIAASLGAPLDVFLVRKVGVPGHEELAMGAIASGGTLVWNESVLRGVGLPAERIQRAVAREREELERRERAYRGERPPPEVRGRTVILVDDGLATGASMRAALAALREKQPARIVVAVPVGARETCRELEGDADEVVCVATPQPFDAVGLWYRDFSQTTDEEVREWLEAARSDAASRPRAGG
jgi:predicted phosphoribosyltransferase